MRDHSGQKINSKTYFPVCKFVENTGPASTESPQVELLLDFRFIFLILVLTVVGKLVGFKWLDLT